jgi:hypothetical protein
LAQQVATADVVGQVPFSTLFRGADLPGESGVTTTPGASFPYVGSTSIEEGRSTELLAVKRSDCSTVHVDFATGAEIASEQEAKEFGGSTATVSIVQQTREAVSVTSPTATVGSGATEVIPGQSWGITATAKTGLGRNYGFTLYFNGYAICDSAEPLGA